MIKLSEYSVTTPLPKEGKSVARTFQPGESLTPVLAYVEKGKLWAATTGATTESVKRTRCEIVGKEFYFKDHERHVSEMVWHMTQINWFGKVVFQQMHCDDGNDPTLKMFATSSDGGKTGKLTYGLRTTDSSQDPKNLTLLDKVTFADDIETRIEIDSQGKITLTASQGDKSSTIEVSLTKGRAARPHVFHWGPYNQINQGSDKEPEGDGTMLYWSDITEDHQGGSAWIIEQIEKAYAQWLSGELNWQQAQEQLNFLSKQTASIPTSEERAPVYALIKEYKAKITK
ncbi:alginate lyase [Pseudomonas phage AH02]|nr:alginate lyase [Pseudomonas phage AH02]